MTTFLALAFLIAQTGTAAGGSQYSREIEARYWLVGSAHGVWPGRRAGPYSEIQTQAIIDQQKRRRSNVVVAVQPDFRQLAQVLAASDAGLSELLLSDDPLLVKNAITEASLRRTRSPVGALCQLAKKGTFREDAVPALAMIGGADAVRCLRLLLDDRNKMVSVSAAYGLSAHGLKDGVAELWYGVRHPIVKSLYENRIIRGHAAKALVQLGAVTTRPQLDEVFRLTRAEGRYLCPLLAKAGKPVQLRKLRDLVVDPSADHLVRKWAATTLGDVRDRAAVANLRRALADPSRQVREAAQAALQSLDEGHR